ncbi:cyclin-dependent kinases regulatory subunit 1 isoform X2 [Psammomys obesus]|uniref:cyclin-dependent kinases regulatory subunit 1 isoform X2 n=1 Tax=Psammomys obesus TaxID=48139 RepID=UPI002452D891|nr:cyclin-dependent kinases regulatory subunit 1 isoform X2 [Psammomys obesus]
MTAREDARGSVEANENPSLTQLTPQKPEPRLHLRRGETPMPANRVLPNGAVPPSAEETNRKCRRHVMLPKDIAKLVPKTHLMSESEWRNLGVQQSQGWVHYMIHEPDI